MFIVKRKTYNYDLSPQPFLFLAFFPEIDDGSCVDVDDVVIRIGSRRNDENKHVLTSLVSEGVLAFLRCRNIDIYGVHKNVKFLRHL